jgi:hypothetical protein
MKHWHTIARHYATSSSDGAKRQLRVIFVRHAPDAPGMSASLGSLPKFGAAGRQLLRKPVTAGAPLIDTKQFPFKRGYARGRASFSDDPLRSPSGYGR